MLGDGIELPRVATESRNAGEHPANHVRVDVFGARIEQVKFLIVERLNPGHLPIPPSSLRQRGRRWLCLRPEYVHLADAVPRSLPCRPSLIEMPGRRRAVF